MPKAKPVTWLVSDIINWFKSKELIINEKFQRHSVWAPQAKTLLIDSILNELPMPKIFIRTKIDAKKQKTIREIVDGQQRIRSIVEFANNDFALSSKSEKYRDLKYSDLSDEDQNNFLSYAITADHLINATDDDVIDIFARLNSYTVALNAAEKRHAAYQTELKFFVRRMSIKYRWFIEKYNIFTLKQRFRMADDEFFAELTRLILHGIGDGGAEKLNKFYKDTTDSDFPDSKQKTTEDTLDSIINFIDTQLGVFMQGILGKHYQIYAISAAYLILLKIHTHPDIAIKDTKLITTQRMRERFSALEREIDEGMPTIFTKASSSSTQRIASRLIRIKKFIKAMSDKDE